MTAVTVPRCWLRLKLLAAVLEQRLGSQSVRVDEGTQMDWNEEKDMWVIVGVWEVVEQSDQEERLCCAPTSWVKM